MQKWLIDIFGLDSRSDIITFSFYLLLLIVVGSYIWREYRNQKLARRSELKRVLDMFRGKTSVLILVFIAIILFVLYHLVGNFISTRI